MSGTIVPKLIAKDLYFHRWLIGLTILTGLGSIWLSSVSEIVGAVAFVTVLTVCAIFVGLVNVTKERAERSSLFVLSLPVSPQQYVAAKVGAASIGYLTAWSVLLAVVLVLSRLDPSPGAGGPESIVSLMTLLLTNFFVLLTVGILTTAEIWVAAAIIGTNLTVPLFFAQSGAPEGAAPGAAGLSPGLVAAFGVEAAIVLLCLGLIYFTQTRRKDFV
ncbi:MAG: ABC-2 transporter permease [Gammaproteobacteria bacterium]|nr:ABC-2 transporter permease [Gammaproteobacteria bacterium]